jgi:hypothetical protein
MSPLSFGGAGGFACRALAHSFFHDVTETRIDLIHFKY